MQEQQPAVESNRVAAATLTAAGRFNEINPMKLRNKFSKSCKSEADS
ncbi:hypothetical protein M8C21_023954 [Ambrosia artemisiifolia]|uniref:Uncharacterized protein n=1 Tax=Ambrosia artemisiifolia TaxID=4212 RepID=A0AAD5BMT5_AMBAR|nr:hypothetical protein M8C21_023954 [Ambrosia artemisiifolia]